MPAPASTTDQPMLAPDAPVGVAYADISGSEPGRFTRVNAAVCDLLGYTEEELRARTTADISHPEDYEQDAAEFVRLLAGDISSYTLEKRLISRSGKIVWVRLYVSLARNEDGEPVHAVGQIIDITDLKRALASQRAMVASSLEAIVGMDAEGFITEFNPAAERIFGYSREVVLGHPLAELIIPAGQRDAHRHGFRRMADGGESRVAGRRMEVTAMRADGSEFPVELTVAVTQDRPVLFTGFIRDLTERQTAERALEQSERRYRRIVETSAEGLWMLDADHRTTFVNPRMAEILGRTPEEMLGRHPFEYSDAEGAEITRKALDRGREGVRESYQSKFIHRDGREVWTWMSGGPLIEDDGTYTGSLAMVSDVSDFVRAERQREGLQLQLNQSQRLETVGKLAGGVAHDFNNLLAVILNYAVFLKEELEDSSEAAEGLSEIRLAAERGAALTQRLLAFSRRDAGRPQLLDLRQVITDVTRMLESSLGDDVELELKVPEELPAVTADLHQLEQLLVNLGVNARDAMAPDGGRLRIRLEEVELDDREAARHAGLGPGRYVRMEVADTGSGMSAEVAASAFDPFFTTKPAGEGTGLGLAMIYGIVQRAGGSVELDTALGEGTTVTVHLPASQQAPDPVEAPGTPAAREAQGESILLVDDEDPVRGVAARILSRHGYKVYEAASGEEALAVYRTLDRAPDLLLTDVAMPRISGLELAQRLTGERPPAPTVVFMSGYSGAAVSSPEALERSSGFVQKPFSPETLLHAGGEALVGRGQPAV